MATQHLFEIVMTRRHHNRGQFIFAKLLSGGLPLNIKDGAMLRDVAVYHYRDMYPMNDKENNPLWDLFVFRPVGMVSYALELFKDGERVMLLVED